MHTRGLAIKLVTDELDHDAFSLLLVGEGNRRVTQLSLDVGGVSGEFSGTRWTAYGCVLVSGDIDTRAGFEYFQLLLAPSGRLLGAWVTY